MFYPKTKIVLLLRVFVLGLVSSGVMLAADSMSIPRLEMIRGSQAGSLAVKVVDPPEAIKSWRLTLTAENSETPLVEVQGKEIPAGGIPLEYPALVPGAQYKLVMRIDDGFEPFEMWLFPGIDPNGRIVEGMEARLEFSESEKPFLELHSLKTPPELKQWSLTIEPAGGGEPVLEDKGVLPLNGSKKWEMLTLPVGDYVAKMGLFPMPGTEDSSLGSLGLVYPFRRDFDFRYAYYPSSQTLRVYIPENTSGNRLALKEMNGWTLEIRKKGGGKVLAQTKGGLPFPEAGLTLVLPELSVGDYELICTVSGSGAPLTVTRTFMRRTHEWEGLKLGQEKVVIPPFTPLVVDEKAATVDSILRQHELDSTGLWSQVIARDEKILSGPIRLEAVIDGKRIVAVGKNLQFLQTEPSVVRGTADWAAGPLTGTTQFEFDYDGFTRFTLKLKKTTSVIESLKLVLPMDPANSTLMHPVTDYLRNHYAGGIPKGEGMVWNSSELDKRRFYLKAPFVPYIYVGGPERGICWSAESDRDWIIDREGKAPSLEIVRQKGSTDLEVNLISKPSALSRDREISFFLQATPAKPMPDSPHNWRRWKDHSSPKVDDVNFELWGGTEYWGAYFTVADYFPEGKDFTWYDIFAHNRKQAALGTPVAPTANDEFLERKLAKYRALLPADRLQSQYRSHWNAGLTWSKGVPANTPDTKKFHYIMPYASPRSLTGYNNDGFRQTYVDEWSMVDVADPNWGKIPRVTREGQPGSIWYELEPVETYVDMTLFYLRKMYETFADGVYWDNFFLQACYTPHEAGGPGYVDDDGVLRPGVNLLAFRNLVKRNAIMMHQMGKKPMAWIHMTNVNVIPLLSFGTLNYEWEWRDLGEFATMDLQDRLHADVSTDLILVQSLGLQSGNPTVICNRFRPPEDSGTSEEWLLRTVQAVSIPHEMKMHEGGSVGDFVQASLEAFGYGQEDCRVYRYWEPAFPLTTTGANNHALVLKRGNKVLIGLGNYGSSERSDPAQAIKPDAADPISIEEYDAKRSNETTHGNKDAKTEVATHEIYTVRLELDLKALGLPDTAQAYDVEFAALREKAGKTPEASLKPRIDLGATKLTHSEDTSVAVESPAYSAQIDSFGNVSVSVQGAGAFTHQFGNPGQPPKTSPTISVDGNQVTIRSDAMMDVWTFGESLIKYQSEGYNFECQLDSSATRIAAPNGREGLLGKYAGSAKTIELSNGQVLESKLPMHVHNQRYFPVGYASGQVKVGQPVENEFIVGSGKGKPLKRIAPGVFEIEIRKHDFTLIEVE